MGPCLQWLFLALCTTRPTALARLLPRNVDASGPLTRMRRRTVAFDSGPIPNSGRESRALCVDQRLAHETVTQSRAGRSNGGDAAESVSSRDYPVRLQPVHKERWRARTEIRRWVGTANDVGQRSPALQTSTLAKQAYGCHGSYGRLGVAADHDLGVVRARLIPYDENSPSLDSSTPRSTAARKARPSDASSRATQTPTRSRNRPRSPRWHAQQTLPGRGAKTPWP